MSQITMPRLSRHKWHVVQRRTGLLGLILTLFYAVGVHAQDQIATHTFTTAADVSGDCRVDAQFSYRVIPSNAVLTRDELISGYVDMSVNAADAGTVDLTGDVGEFYPLPLQGGVVSWLGVPHYHGVFQSHIVYAMRMGEDGGSFGENPFTGCSFQGSWSLEFHDDTDYDNITDATDNCRLVANFDQRDTDNDGFGNLCDADLNNDNMVNLIDLGTLKSVFFSSDPHADFNGDGIVNAIDLGIMRQSFFSPPGPGADVECRLAQAASCP